MQDDPSRQVHLRPARSEGGAADAQGMPSLEMAIAYVNKADEIKAAAIAALKESAANDPSVRCTDGVGVVPAGNTAATEETGRGGGM